MFTTFSKKFLMAGIITITLPFGGWTVTTSGVTPVSTVAPAASGAPTAINSSVGSNDSYNWSGYEATGGTFTAISGTWTIPSIPTANSVEADATWVGIGGVTGHDLIQAGTQAVIDDGSNSGTPQYQAWYEMLPDTTQQVPLTVSPGDSITASLTQTSQGEWSVSIRDNTTGQGYQTSLAYNSSLSSAEWIEEMPSDGTNFVPIDNFGSIPFTGGTTTENGNSLSISGVNAQELTMVNRAGQTLASPSLLGADGESFTVTRTSASPTVAAIGRGGLGRGWRRTGVGIQGYAPMPASSSSVSGATTGTTGGAAWQSFYQLLQELHQLQQQLQLQQQTQNIRQGFVRATARFRR